MVHPPPSGISPEFRAWYSSNPSFTAGAAETPVSEHQSILVDEPSITEGLEALALARGEDEQPTETHKPLDTSLAMQGLKQIRKGEHTADEVPVLKEAAVKTRRTIKSRLEQEEREREARLVATPAPLAEDAAENGRAARQEARLKAQAEHEESRSGSANKLFGLIQERYPTLGLDDYIDLFVRLSGKPKDGGRVEIKTGNGFHSATYELLEEIKSDPERLSNLSYACSLLTGLNRESEPGERRILRPYIDFMREHVWDQLERTQLDISSVPSDVLARWFDFIDQAPLELLRQTDNRDGLLRSEFDRNEPHVQGIVGSRHFLQFLTNDLLATVDKYHPAPIVDKFYRVAEHGFDIDLTGPEETTTPLLAQSPRVNRTLDLMATIFEQRPVAVMLLANGAGSQLSMDYRLKMLDLKLFMAAIGVGDLLRAPNRVSTGPVDLDARSARLLEKIYPHKPAPPEYMHGSINTIMSDNEAMGELVRETSEELARRIESPDTKGSYLIGRNINVDPDDVRHMPIEFRT